MRKGLGVLAMVVGLAIGLGVLPAFGAATTGSGAAAAKVNVNTGGMDQLAALPGIGEVIAKAIVDFRKMNGPFRSAEDLLQVKGIGEKKLEAIRSLITLE